MNEYDNLDMATVVVFWGLVGWLLPRIAVAIKRLIWS